MTAAGSDRGDPPLDYASYLRLPQLLSLQQPLSSPVEHDEHLFIVIHQATELWFNELLHELDGLKEALGSGNVWGSMHLVRRAKTILTTLVAQLAILETMTPLSFSRFRSILETSSGFQSLQFREIEFVLGHKQADLLALYPPTMFGFESAERRLHERSIPDHLLDFLEHHGLTIPADLREAPVTDPHRPDERIQDMIFALYEAEHRSRMLFELLVDLDEGFQEWRYRHLKVVQRTIGNKTGTGGTGGVAYLFATLNQPFFPDLWAIRHRF
ncbi:MAG: tryptophan 2,3-dioxygenase family protein [Acidimicrobiales bacterium]